MIKIFNVWRSSFKEIAAVRYFQIAILGGLFVLICTALLPIWRLFPMGLQAKPAIPLHYNIYSGIDLFGPWWYIFMIPAIGLIIFIFNLLCAVAIWRREKVLSYFYIGVSAGSQLILFVAMVFVVLLNLSYG